MDGRLPLYYLSAAIGGFIAVGCIWLLAKQKIYLDHHSNEVIEVELPFLGKLKTGYPVLILFAFALVLVIYPLNEVKTMENYLKTDEMDVTGRVTAHYPPVMVYAAPAFDLRNSDSEFHVRLPFSNRQNEYHILVIEGNHVAAEGSASLSTAKKGIINVELSAVEIAPSPWKPELKPVGNLSQYVDVPQPK